MRVEVHKYGGTSVGDATRIASVARLSQAAAQRCGLVVVSSAMSKVTDRLVAAVDDIAAGRPEAAIDAVALPGPGDSGLGTLLGRHLAVLDALAPSDLAARDEVASIAREVATLIEASARIGEVTSRVRDRVLASGEKMAVRLVAAALRAVGQPAQAVDADTFLDTDGHHGGATPLLGVAERMTASRLRPLVEQGVVPVVTGFCGRAPDGSTTTLGRGGSDYSATFVGGALDADEVTIWTDVDGVYSADPRIVPEALVIPQLNYREAAEMSYYGAKVLHQRTMIPVASKRIPVVTRNSFAPEAPGTCVDGRFTPGSHPVKAISAVRRHCLVSIEGKGMAGVPGVAARVFGALAAAHISVTMISQSSSESSICLAVPEADAGTAEAVLKAAFRSDISYGDVEEIVVQRHVGLIAAVGLGMAHTPGVSARVFRALAQRGINVLAIAQGSSELNISLAVAERDVENGIRAIHREFGLHRLDTGVDTAGHFDLILLGCGNIGRALVELVLDRHAHMFERFGLHAKIVALADRSGYVGRPAGLGLDELRAVLDAKAAGRALASLPDGIAASHPADVVRAMLAYRLARPVLVDVSDSDGAHSAFVAAFEGNCDVVTANKKPLAGSLESYRTLMGRAAAEGRLLRAEATVGAGLPVIDTLDMLMATGDRLVSAVGCLSGTLGFVMDRLEAGVPFSEAVLDAQRRGYTEPDPVVDLLGEDVARKAIILGRVSGLWAADAPPTLSGLVDRNLLGTDAAGLADALRAYDAPLAERVAHARSAGKVLRFVARVSRDGLEVGPQEVDADSPLGMLKGTDNMVVFTSERYATRPLVVSGPGAGVEVTAMGVLGDILRIAAERR